MTTKLGLVADGGRQESRLFPSIPQHDSPWGWGRGDGDTRQAVGVNTAVDCPGLHATHHSLHPRGTSCHTQTHKPCLAADWATLRPCCLGPPGCEQSSFETWREQVMESQKNWCGPNSPTAPLVYIHTTVLVTETTWVWTTPPWIQQPCSPTH